jgi:phage gp46-like protein
MTDVLLRQTNDGGEITVENGLTLMADGLETAAYLSLYGGNLEDAGDNASKPVQWWGNLDETEPESVYRSETQHLMRALAAVPANLRRFEQAALRDLAWFVDTGVALSVDVSARIPALNRVKLDVTIVTLKGELHLSFS